jgi:UDP-glucose 4-epimerase
MLALKHLRAGGASLTCNCGYGRGLSVLEVIDVVKKVSGVDFPVRISGRRAGDPANLIAGAERIRSELGWTPKSRRRRRHRAAGARLGAPAAQHEEHVRA